MSQTITFQNTNLADGLASLEKLNLQDGQLPPQPISGVVQQDGNFLFTGKTIFANGDSDTAANIIPICTKAIRLYDPGASKENIQNQVARFVEFRATANTGNNYLISFPTGLGIAGSVMMDLLGDGVLSFQPAGAGSGTIEGGPFVIDNALVRVDTSVNPETIQDSGIIINDTDDMTGVTSITLDENVIFSVNPLNTLYGFDSGDSISSGTSSTLVGFNSGNAQSTASNVTAIGDSAGSLANISGNIYIGSGSAENVTSGTQMVIIGTDACQSMTGGIGSVVAIGNTALQSATNTPSSIAIGNQSMSSLLTGSGNVIIGPLGMRNATACGNNTGTGFDVLHDNLTGSSNSCYGWESGFSITSGDFNSLYGKSCCQNLLTGDLNIVLGNNAASNYVAAESNNIILAAAGLASENGAIRIGINGTHITTFIQGIHSVTPSGATQHVIIDASGELGSTSSGGLVGVTDTENTFLGVGSATSITSGDSNVILGFNAANFMTTAGESVIIGAHAAENALNTGRGIFIGANSGLNADVTSGTIAIGFNSLQNLVSPSTGNTVAIGHECMQMATTAGGTTAVGALCLKQLTTSVLNTGYGRFTLTNIKDNCDSNCGIGAGSIGSLGLGVLGTGVGNSNTGCGTNTLFILGGSVAGDDFNCAFGRSSGALVTGSSNLYLGHLSGSAHGDAAGENNNVCVMSPGVSAEQNTQHYGIQGSHTSTFIAGITGVVPSGTPQVVIFDPVTGEMGEGQIQMNGSGDMSMVNAMDVNGTGQILLQTSLDGLTAIKLNATGTASGIDIDATGLIDIDSSNANTGAVHLIASDTAGGIKLTSGTGGIDLTSNGLIDIETLINTQPAISIRATGTDASIEFDAGTNGVRIIDGGVGLFIDDTSSMFAQQIRVPTFAGDIQWTLPSSQGSSGQVLTNGNGAGGLTWTTPVTTGNVNTTSPPYVVGRVAVFENTGGTEIDQRLVEISTGNAMSGLAGIASTGGIDFNTCATFDLVTTNNTSTALHIEAQGGTSAEISILNSTGTNADSIDITSTSGGLDINAGLQINIDSSEATFDAIHLHATNASGGIELDADAGITITNSNVEGLIFDDSTSVFNVSMKASSLTTESHDIILPVASATVNGQVLSSTTSGVTSWANAASSGLPTGYLFGFLQTGTSTTVVTFGTSGEPSKCRDGTDTADLQWASDTETITTSVTGVGGITDTQNPVSANQGYEVYIVHDTTDTNPDDILAVESGTDITTVIEFTGGDFDLFHRIGFFCTEDGSTAIIPHNVGGKGHSRTFHYTGGRGSQTILFAGSATTWTDMASGGDGSEQYTPPQTHHIVCRIAFGDSASANDEVVFRQNGSTLAASDSEYTFSAGSALAAGELADSQILIHLNRTDRITEYEVTAAANNAYAYIISFAFDL